jgi:FAD/FMN-containing dehydrogenase
MAVATTLAGLDELRAQMRGDVLTQGDAGYDEARKVYNGSIDRYPAAVARCADAADVSAAITYTREQGLEIAIRGGGHSGAGYGTVEGGLLIDLSPQRWVRVDPDTRLVQVGGGCELGDIDHATHPYGLAVPFGTFSITGIGGLALGGGLGHLTRKHGLTIDNMVEADVVLADGSIVKASEEQNPELFWAMRGGGGNFGVVTAIHVPGASGVHRACRPDVLAARADTGGHALLGGLPRGCTRRADGVLRVADDSGRAALPRAAPQREGVRDRLVLDGRR